MWTVPSCFSAERATVPTHTGAGIQALITRLCLDFRCVRPTHGALFSTVRYAGLCIRECCYVIPRVAGNRAGLFIALANPCSFPVSMIVLPSHFFHGGD